MSKIIASTEDRILLDLVIIIFPPFQVQQKSTVCIRRCFNCVLYFVLSAVYDGERDVSIDGDLHYFVGHPVRCDPVGGIA